MTDSQQPYSDDEPVRMRSEMPTFTVSEETAAATAAPEPTTPSRKRRNLIIGAAIAAVAIAGITIGITATSGPGSITIHGSLSMGVLTYTDDAPGADLTNPGLGDPCSAGDGYSDIAPGATVTIGGANGQSIAVAALSAGKVAASGSCEFDFTASVPDQSSYTVTIGHRGTTTWTKAQATSAAGMTLSLTYAG
jgi:hypothetical protein